MITVSDAARAVIDAGTMTYQVTATAWLSDILLADDIPVAEATEESDRSLNVPERVTLTIPRRDDAGNDWTPTSADSPLAANGQTLKITLGVGVGRGVAEWFQRGEFLISSSKVSDDGLSIAVTCVGLLYLVQEAGFVAPFQPSGTIAGTFRALISPALEADLNDAPTDRAVPAGITWDDRIGALYSLLDAWPGVLRMNEGGWVEVHPDTTPTVAVRSFTDGAGGTVVAVSGGSTRDGAFNVVVATGQAADGTEVRGLAWVDVGAWSYLDGVANPLPVPFGYASPLITTQTQAAAAAATVLRRKMRQAVLRRFTITAAPDPTLQTGDPVAVSTADGQLAGVLCTVEHLTLPYTPGPMTVDVVTVSGE